MKDTIYPIDIATGEYVQGIQMTDEEERKRRKKYWELRNAKELRRIDHGPLGKFYLSACRSEQFEGLKPQDITRLIYLVSHLNYKSVLMLNERRKMTLTDLPAVLNVSDSTDVHRQGKNNEANLGNAHLVVALESGWQDRCSCEQSRPRGRNYI